MSVPKHQLSESPNSRSIEINDWLITASTNPISNAGESDALQAELGIPLPEMTFGNNYLSLEHRRSGWNYAFCTGNALSGVKNGELGQGDGGVKVGYADAWLKSRYGIHSINGGDPFQTRYLCRTDPNSALPMPKTVATKPYDWTYTTTYAGHPPSHTDYGSPPSTTRPPGLISWISADQDNPSHSIPMAELTRPDPILFYAEIPLFEDELHDNGSSSLIVRIVRVFSLISALY